MTVSVLSNHGESQILMMIRVSHTLTLSHKTCVLSLLHCGLYPISPSLDDCKEALQRSREVFIGLTTRRAESCHVHMVLVDVRMLLDVLAIEERGRIRYNLAIEKLYGRYSLAFLEAVKLDLFMWRDVLVEHLIEIAFNSAQLFSIWFQPSENLFVQTEATR